MALKLGFWLAWSLAIAWWGWQFVRLQYSSLSPGQYGQLFRENVWIGFLLLAGMIAGTF